MADLEISHEKYKSTINEKENHRRLKKTEQWKLMIKDELSENNKNIRENNENV